MIEELIPVIGVYQALLLSGFNMAVLNENLSK
jgi:hypothetical protein